MENEGRNEGGQPRVCIGGGSYEASIPVSTNAGDAILDGLRGARSVLL